MSHKKIIEQLKNIDSKLAEISGRSSTADNTGMFFFPEHGTRATVPAERLKIDFENGTVESMESSYSEEFQGIKDRPGIEKVRSLVFFSTLDGALYLNENSGASFIDQCNWHVYQNLDMEEDTVVMDLGHHSKGIKPKKTVEMNFIASDSPEPIYEPLVQRIHQNNKVEISTGDSYAAEVVQHPASFDEVMLKIDNTDSTNSADIDLQTALLNHFTSKSGYPKTVAAGDTLEIHLDDPMHAYKILTKSSTSGSPADLTIEFMHFG